MIHVHVILTTVYKDETPLKITLKCYAIFVTFKLNIQIDIRGLLSLKLLQLLKHERTTRHRVVSLS